MKLLTGLCLYTLNSQVEANVLGQSYTGVRTYCDNNPCANEGVCLMKAGRSYCECPNGWHGSKCEVPSPHLTCSPDQMKISIDKRLLVRDQNSSPDSEKISLGNSDDAECQAVDDGNGNYVLSINSPFQDHCGTNLVRNEENSNYDFQNDVMWTMTQNGLPGEAAIQRRHKLVDFKCSYEDEYLLHMKPLKAAESTIEKTINKGSFDVDMTLWKNSDFENDVNGQYSDNPIIRISQQVCVKLDLESNLDMQNLVLTAADCWASHSDNPSEEEKHYMIKGKCQSEEDYTTTIKKNGIDTEVKFCFQIFKWKEQMDELFVQCKLSVCDDSIQFDGVSQCTCPPANYELNSWFYPQYYYANMGDEYGDYYGYGLYGDDAYSSSSDNYGNTYYYDYVAPWTGGRKRRSAPVNDDTEESVNLANTDDSLPSSDEKFVLPNSADYVPMNMATEGSKKRKRYELGGKLRDPETGEIKEEFKDLVKADTDKDYIEIGYGPITIKEAESRDPEALKQKEEKMAEISVTRLDEEIEWFETEESANNVILIAVGGALILAIVILGIVIGVYVQFKNNDKEKAFAQVQDTQNVKQFYQNVIKGQAEN